jgi:glycosyltransferase involved in cell wall biosynthesis
MTVSYNSAPLLLDVTRQIWRRWEGVRPTGIDRLCDAWLEHYAARAQAVIITKGRQVILPVAASQALFAALSAPTSSARATAIFRRKLIAIALRWGWRWVRNLDGRGRLWLNAGHTGLHHLTLGDWCARANVRPIYLVHDLIPITHPQFCRPGEDAKHTNRILTVLNTATAVVANSRHTRDTLARFAETLGKPAPRFTIAWPGCASLNRGPVADGAAELPTFVILGTIEARKNHALLLSVWKRLVDTMGEACPRLVIVGRRGWEADDVFAVLDQDDFGGKVIEAGALDDAALAQVLGPARALLFPSQAEGFGIPLVEALAAGIPVIASNLEVFAEVAGDVPELLPPDDIEAWIAALTDYAKPDSVRRARQLARLADYAPPTWDEHFARVDALLEELS